jgi:hypothetical protein
MYTIWSNAALLGFIGILKIVAVVMFGSLRRLEAVACASISDFSLGRAMAHLVIAIRVEILELCIAWTAEGAI